jgi:hypothetical protein
VSDLILLVQQVTYMGKLRDAEQLYPGEHAGIVDTELWERANAAVTVWGSSKMGKQRHDRWPKRTAAHAGPVAATPSVPRISRLLALALKMEQMIADGTVKNYGELAHLGQVSAARISQVMNLLHLAPDIQEDILLGSTPEDRVRESAVRKLSAVALWSEQRDGWRKLLAAGGVRKLAVRV